LPKTIDETMSGVTLTKLAVGEGRQDLSATADNKGLSRSEPPEAPVTGEECVGEDES